MVPNFSFNAGRISSEKLLRLDKWPQTAREAENSLAPYKSYPARKRSGLEYLETVLRYLSRGTDQLKPDDLRQAVTQARIVPIRQEQLKERLGERFRELDIPLLVEWPDGRREAILFIVEEETDPKRFSVHRLAHYCLDIAELIKTERVVPVVIFLHPGDYPRPGTHRPGAARLPVFE